jgi:conjugal transfer pilus assembly protein TraV
MSRSFIFIFAISVTGALVSACSPMNSEFSCNATAGDSCMSIEQVDEMTRFANEGRPKQRFSERRRHRSEVSHEQHSENGQALVWVAPANKLSEIAFKTSGSPLIKTQG